MTDLMGRLASIPYYRYTIEHELGTGSKDGASQTNGG